LGFQTGGANVVTSPHPQDFMAAIHGALQAESWDDFVSFSLCNKTHREHLGDDKLSKSRPKLYDVAIVAEKLNKIDRDLCLSALVF
jgi:hypothetical protein